MPDRNPTNPVRGTVEAQRSIAEETVLDLDEMLLREKAHVVGLRDAELQRMVASDDLFGLALSGRFCDDAHGLFDGSCSASKGAERRPSFFPE